MGREPVGGGGGEEEGAQEGEHWRGAIEGGTEASATGGQSAKDGAGEGEGEEHA